MRVLGIFVVFGTLTLSEGNAVTIERRDDGQCPASHPNVYYNGEYCCSSDQEKVYAPQGAQCDGSRIQKNSLCCAGDSYVPCPSGNCEDYSDPEGWSRNEGKYLGGYSSGVAKYDTLGEAVGECSNRNDCGGVTYEQGSKKYTLRQGPDLRASPSNEISWIEKAEGWSRNEGKYLGGYSSGVAKYDTLGEALGQCSNRNANDCGGVTYEQGSKKYTLRRGPDLRTSPSNEISWIRKPKLTAAWSQIPGGLTRISEGKSGVWGVNSNGNIYILNADRKSFTQIAGALVQVASGAEVWGVNSGDAIWRYLGENKWENMPGRLTNVASSDNGNVWGINRQQNIYRWLGSSWQHIGGKAIEVSVGLSGVWVVNNDNNIYYREGTRGDLHVAGSKWVHVPGKLKWIASGKDIVVGVNAYDDIYFRDGISNRAPMGTGWVKIDGKLSQIDVFDDEVVGTNSAMNIYRTPYEAPSAPVMAGQSDAPLKGLQVGDKVSFSAIYSKTSARFGLNIKDTAGNYLFRLAFRQATDPRGDGPICVLDSRLNNNWQGQMRAAFPQFEDGKEFSITISVLEDKYTCDFNGEPMEDVEFPHRQNKANAAVLELWGGAAMGANGVPILWNKIVKTAPPKLEAAVAEEAEGNWFETHPPTGFKGAGGGVWTIGDKTVHAGTDGDIPIPADYFNEGRKRLAVFRPSNGVWYIKGADFNDWGSSEGNVWIQCGANGDVPVPGDYKGDGKTSIAVFRPSNGNWYIKGPGNSNWGETSGNTVVQCGTNGDVPVPFDYFNEGKLRIAVWRPSNGVWYIKGPGLGNWGSSAGNVWIQCGVNGDVPVPGDYYGDGTIRLAVWRPSSGTWFIKGPGNNNWAQSTGNKAIQCGANGDIPVPGDYFNEGKLRLAVFRPSNGKLYIKGNDMENWGSSSGNIIYPAEGSLPSQTVVSSWTIPKREVAEGEKDEEINILQLEGVVASQKDIAHGGIPERAIDGNTNGQWGSGTCTHTQGSRDNWWKAELGAIYKIKRVVLHNRLDCCSGRINRARVMVGPVICGEVVFTAGQSRYEIDCAGAVGGQIKVVQPFDILTLCEVEAYGEETDEKPLKNVARAMPTWESSVGWGGVASRAVDGKTSGVWGAGTCTHSGNAGFNQWRVDLLDQYDVDSVLIYNRLDCCQERINGAKVYVGETLCGAVEWAAGKSVFQVNCDGASGTKVRITQDGQYLTLCEVQVLGKPSEDLGPLVNIAEDGEATQSNVGWGGVADRAIDGNTDMIWNKGSCSHTGNVNSGWWNLEFPEPVPINSVIIYNRQDCCQNRINGVKVYADDTLCGTIRYDETQEVYKVRCSSDLVENVIAKNIKIMAAENEYLTLCEVKVLSDPTVEVGAEHLVNLAYKKPTSQSSTGWGGVSDRAVDGLESGKWTKGTCTHTNGAGWWMVDLKDNYAVEKVWIKNRIDCCSNRIDGVKVYVGDQLCGTVTYNPIKYSYTVECGEGHGLVGQTVKIVNEQTYLTLCEVKVWGPADPIIEGMESLEEVLGEKSEAKDDETSTASCPVGKVAAYCEVQTGNVGVNADGALVKSEGADCVAYNGWGGQGVIARALCTEEEQIGDPCNGPKLMKFKYIYNRGQPSPSAECPTGYEPLVCNAHSFWFDKLANKGITDKGVIPNDRACAVADCTDSNWCDVSLVCKLMENLNDYAAAVCPDCEGWNCGEGQECQMVEAEDESGQQSPTCVEKQTGCDVDRCGDHGECEPVGTNDYTCQCEDGYEFDERAGTCMPKHSKYETVYGEPAIGDDATSFASCSVGQKVMRCHTFGAPGAADGVTITTTDGIVRCEARASHSRTFPIRAVAYCGDDNPTTDPCTQDEIHGIEYRISVDNSPSVSCPGGFVMESCIFHSPWTQLLTDENRARINSIGSVDINDDGTCSIDNCLRNAEHRWCKLTAICKKLTGSEYLKGACPTCDDVRCPEGQECKMAHELPTCVARIPGGCEEDKCGKGECVEDGSDYECLCDEGYAFDGTTCADVDECAEEPCGNGECTNTEGSYECDCNDGYELVHGSCEDINECLDNPCDDTERCSNVEGSYICDCLDTFVKNKGGDCVCADGYENQNGECVDVNECDDDPCGENEVCTNEVGSYTCDCAEGAEKGPEGVCETLKHIECDIKPKKSKVMGFKGTNVNVKLKGEKKKVFKKYAKITWTKNNQPWHPKDDGKDKLNGFVIRNFDADDVGIYRGSIYIDENGEISVCDVEVETELLEGSVTLRIENEENLMKPQKAGKTLKIKCDLDLVNVKLEDPKSPDNVNWYRVTEDGDELLDDTDSIAIERARGTYQLVFNNPTSEDSGTYRCEFDQLGLEVSTDVSIQVV